MSRGVRLHIRKQLRAWRQEFARHLRKLGVAANATERSVRGPSRPGREMGFIGRRSEVGRRICERRWRKRRGSWRQDGWGSRKEGLVCLRRGRRWSRGWRAVSEILVSQGQQE